MPTNHQSWLVIGRPENWEISLGQPIPIWGLIPHYSASFQSLREGDVLWIYVTSPVRGVVGVGYVKDKYIDNSNLVWPQEWEEHRVKWPLRFRIHLQKFIPRDQWEARKITIADFGLNWQIGFQCLDDNQAAHLLKRSDRVLGDEIDEGATIVTPRVANSATIVSLAADAPPSKHRDLQVLVAEIGKLQFYHTELEYPLDLKGEHKSLDVVWKREVGGVPTFAFEVEFSSGLERAVGRLKFAYRCWNSRPRIIVPPADLQRLQNIAATEDANFAHQLRVYEPSQLVKLLEKKKDLKTLEQDLGIY